MVECTLYFTGSRKSGIAMNAPIIYNAACVMFLMRANTLRWHVGGDCALEIESFLGPEGCGGVPSPHLELIRNQRETVRCIKDAPVLNIPT